MWKLANGLIRSFRTVLSAFVLIVLTVYVFACLGVELITKDPTLRQDPVTAELIQSHFPTLPVTMLTLITAVIVDTAIAQGGADRELERKTKQKRLRALEPILKDLFHELDYNGNDKVSLHEFRSGLKNTNTKKHLPEDMRKILDS